MSHTDNILVAIRVRPLNAREQAHHKAPLIRIDPITNTIVPVNATADGQNAVMSYDHVYDPTAKTDEVFFRTVRNLIDSVMLGINATSFAYGQTSSGKSFTMFGDKTSPGVIPMAIDHIFTSIQDTPEREFVMRASFLEIYQETLFDLFAVPPPVNSQIKPTELKISEHYERGVFVENQIEVNVESPEHILELLMGGQARRRTGSTCMNHDSSRSHSIFRIVIESREAQSTLNESENGLGMTSTGGAVRVASLNLVDLAGSERARQTGATGARLKEGASINRSLHYLSEVIHALSEYALFVRKSAHIPYRNSKLTRILQPALGGNTRTAIICTITLADMHHEETMSTLAFASRAKRISNQVTVNEIVDDQTQIKKLRAEIASLKAASSVPIITVHPATASIVEVDLEKQKLEAAENAQKLESAEQELSRLRQFVLTSASLSGGGLISGSDCSSLVVGGPDAKRKKTSRRATCAPAQFASSTTTPLFYRAGSALDYARQMLQTQTTLPISIAEESSEEMNLVGIEHTADNTSVGTSLVNNPFARFTSTNSSNSRQSMFLPTTTGCNISIDSGLISSQTSFEATLLTKRKILSALGDTPTVTSVIVDLSDQNNMIISDTNQNNAMLQQQLANKHVELGRVQSFPIKVSTSHVSCGTLSLERVDCASQCVNMLCETHVSGTQTELDVDALQHQLIVSHDRCNLLEVQLHSSNTKLNGCEQELALRTVELQRSAADHADMAAQVLATATINAAERESNQNEIFRLAEVAALSEAAMQAQLQLVESERTSLLMQLDQRSITCDEFNGIILALRASITELEQQGEAVTRLSDERQRSILDYEEQVDGLKQQSARMSFYVPSGGVKSGAVGSSTTGTATGALDKNKLQQRETEKLKARLEASETKLRQAAQERTASATDRATLDAECKKLTRQLGLLEKENDKVKQLQSAKMELTSTLRTLEKRTDLLQKQADRAVLEAEAAAEVNARLEASLEALRTDASAQLQLASIRLGELEAGQQKAAAAAIIEAEAKIQLEQTCVEYEQNLQALESQLAIVSADLENVGLQLADTTTRYEATNEELVNVSLSFTTTAQQLQMQRDETENLAEQLRDKSTRFIELQSSVNGLNDRLDQSTSQTQSLMGQIQAATEAEQLRFEQQRNDADNLERISNALVDESATVKDCELRLLTLTQLLESTNQQRQQLQSITQQADQRIRLLETQAAEWDEQLRRGGDTLMARDAELAELRSQKERLTIQMEGSLDLATRLQAQLKSTTAEAVLRLEEKQLLQRQVNSLTDEAQVSVAQVASLQHDCTERVLQVTQFAAALDTEKLQHQAKIELVRTLQQQLSTRMHDKSAADAHLTAVRSEAELRLDDQYTTSQRILNETRVQMTAQKQINEQLTSRLLSLESESESVLATMTAETAQVKQDASVAAIRVQTLQTSQTQLQEEREVLLDREQELEAVVEKQKTLNREAMSKLAGNHNIVAGLRAENEKSRALAESSQADFVLLEKQSSLRDTNNQQRTHMLETENERLRLDLGVHQENASRLQAQLAAVPVVVPASAFAQNPDRVLKKLVMATRNVYRNASKISSAAAASSPIVVDKENVFPGINQAVLSTENMVAKCAPRTTVDPLPMSAQKVTASSRLAIMQRKSMMTVNPQLLAESDDE